MENTSTLHDHGNSHDLTLILEQSRKTEDFRKISDIFEKLGDAKRAQIFWILCHCEECVSDLSEIIGMTSPAVSHHLKVLKECGLIESHREGKEVIYHVTDSELTRLLHVTTEEIMAFSCPDSEIVPESLRKENSELCHTCGRKNHSHASHLTGHMCLNHEKKEPSSEKSSPRKNTGNTLATEIHDYLNAHLDQHITIDSLAKHFCVNATTVKTVFRQEFGNSIAAHTKEHRMEKAADLLLHSDYSIEEIASMVGYRNQSKFTQAFKEAYNTLPKDYKKQYP
ncbi:MAG: metalloregulator ArsR/SmtB family transcription factor [Lachnospiraceae bacterium]|nr:metalloregulator ArsR/SmtB family transcription factor [Lachnospiraceae bacterium]